MARRHNELILAKHRLSMQAQRLFLYVVSLVNNDHDEQTEYEFAVNELANVIGIDRSRLYKSMVDVIEEVASCMVELPVIDEAGKPVANTIVRVGLIKNRQRVRFNGEGEMRLAGSVSVSLFKELLPYVRELKARFTEVELKYAFRLPSGYSLRIYDLLKMRAFRGQPWRVEREELRRLLGVKEDEYALWGDFRRFVLERAQKDITTHTDISFDIDYVMTGRAVTELIFILRKEGGSDVDVSPGTDKHKVFKGLLELGLSAKDAENVIKDWWTEDRESLLWHLAEARRLKSIGKVKNAIGWLLTGLKEDYRPTRSLFAEMRKKTERVRDEYMKEKGDDVAPEVRKAIGDLAQNWNADSRK